MITTCCHYGDAAKWLGTEHAVRWWDSLCQLVAHCQPPITTCGMLVTAMHGSRLQHQKNNILPDLQTPPASLKLSDPNPKSLAGCNRK